MGKKRNPCLLVTNTNCATHQQKCIRFKQSQIAARHLFQDTFKCEVRELDNLQGKEIEKLFKEIKKSEKFSDIDFFSCVLISCGDEDNQSPYMFGSDGIFVRLETIIRRVCENEDLRAVPKLFLVLLNRCNRENFKTFRPAGGDGENQPRVWGSKFADNFVYYAILEEGRSQNEVRAFCKDIFWVI